MKWPKQLSFIRHGQSAYNAIKKQRDSSPVYKEFRELFEKEYHSIVDERWASKRLKDLARKAWMELRPSVGDAETPLTKEGWRQSEVTGTQLKVMRFEVPDVIYVSPYLRTQQTLEGLTKGYPKLGRARVIFDERLREQEHGIRTIYSDWRIFMVFHPEQALLYRLEGEYQYKFPNGENKPMVRDRVRSMVSTIIRENSGEGVMLISHHLVLLSLRANLERWNREKFIAVDQKETPVNCGVTVYCGLPSRGKNGKICLEGYNQKLY